MTTTASDVPAGAEALPTPAGGPSSRRVTVYEPTTFTLRGVSAYIRALWARRSLIWHLTRSELKAENYDTVLGQMWLILNPLFLALTYLFIRTMLRPMGTPAERNALVAHLIVSVFFFHFTSDILNPGARAIVGQRQLVLNTEVPRGVFPVQKLLRGILDFGPMLVVLFGIQALLGQPFSTAMFWLPAYIAVQAVFSFGLVLFFCTLTVYFRDTVNALRFTTRIWLFTTPVLFTIAEIPDAALPYLKLNPLFPLFAAYEEIFDGLQPDPGYLAWASAWAVSVCLLGAIFFLLRERNFASRL